MRVFLDTSVLVAGMLKGHPRHTVALPWLQRIQQRTDVGLVAVYDAVLLHAAQKANVEQIVTLNEAHFRRVYPALADKVVSL